MRGIHCVEIVKRALLCGQSDIVLSVKRNGQRACRME
nr:MAG TPA: hypothetical protein [Caudoviricetes sp.]